jgi:N4-gp56 family major capsid protein
MANTLSADIPQAIRDVFSQEIIYAAKPKMRFAQFAKFRQDLTQNAGGTVKFTKFNSIAKGGKLTEGVNISEKAMGTSEISISIDEYGNAIKVSELALKKSMFDVLQEASLLLGHDCSQVLDESLRDAALSTTNIIYGNGKAAAADLVAGDGLKTTTIMDVVEALSTNNAPRFEGQYYICIAHPHQLRQLREDPNWIETHKYNGVDQIYKGEVGMYEGVRFVETTQMPANAAADSAAAYGTAAGVGTWEAVVFGENSYAWAEALPVEMRDNGVEDYGRMHGIAWYAIWGFGLIEEGNIFKVLTA